MPDVVDPATRSRMMSGIRGKNTKPELLIRCGLHAAGLRYRIHCAELPGKPDLCFSRKKAVIFVHGCFWHGHDCHLFKWPSSRPDFWRRKIERNKAVDLAARQALLDQGWRIAEIWECALKGRNRLPVDEVIGRCADWIRNGGEYLEVRGAG